METIDDVQKLLSRYVAQLVNGCGDSKCTELQCHTGRLNTTKQPIRQLTTRAARSIALTICDGPQPRSHICPFYENKGPATIVRSETERDPSSMVQQLVDTPSIYRLCGPAGPTGGPAFESSAELKELRDMHRQLMPLCGSSAHLPGKGLATNSAIADTLNHPLNWLIDRVPLKRLAPWYWVDAEVISKGNAYPQVASNKPADGNYNTWLAILDILDHGPYSRLLESICKVVTKRCWLEHTLVSANPNRSRSPSDSICAMVLSHLLSDNFDQMEPPDTTEWEKVWSKVERIIALSIWLKKLFAQQWNAEPVIQRSSPCYGLLEIIRALHDRLYDLLSIHSAFRPGVFMMKFLTMHISVADFGRSWVDGVCHDSVHLLHYRFLFPKDQLYLIFRTINHLTMSQAHLLVIQARKVREKITGVHDDNINEQQRLAETNCLLLSVSRKDMLRDTFDQLWHRRKAELRRPLRVRLGTINELQVGQDLGGVQMEFFNLICREVLDEQAQMFTTDAKTGCSSLRAGSMQPLQYFRQFGVLLALAMYNGITLPITLPKAFYRFLIERTPAFALHMLDDGWPEIAKSLRNPTDEDIRDLDFTYDLSANGIHLTVLAPRQGRIGNNTKRPADVPSSSSDPTTLDPSLQRRGSKLAEDQHILSPSVPLVLRVVNQHPSTVNLGEIHWPGWTFEKADESDVQAVTPANKLQYIRTKVYWHAYLSVAPQLMALVEGFDSADLFPSSTLRTLFTTNTLKAYTEGTDYLDIDKLRAAASYTDYHPMEEYIRAFWRMVSSWPQSKQKQLLKFVTAAERIPISGPSQLAFTIKRAHNQEHLPTSHTCFGTLDLPRYANSKILEEKLSLALRYGSEGFGMG